MGDTSLISAETCILLISGLGFFSLLGCALYCLCQECRSQVTVSNATPLQQEEAQKIISLMQGEWDVKEITNTITLAIPQERVRVEGSVVSGKYSRGSGYDRTLFTLRPAKLENGTLILDARGTKVEDLRPEEGYLKTSLQGNTFEWEKVVEVEQMTLGAATTSSLVNIHPRNSAPQLHSPTHLYRQDQPITLTNSQFNSCHGSTLPHESFGSHNSTGSHGRKQASSSGNLTDIVNDLARLNQLWDQGGLTEEEFAAAKFKVLNPGVKVPSGGGSSYEEPPPYPGNLEKGALYSGPSAPIMYH